MYAIAKKYKQLREKVEGRSKMLKKNIMIQGIGVQ